MKFLIVDDSIFARYAVEGYLKELFGDAEFALAADGVEGFEKYKEFNPDYCLIDLLMPVMGGQELVRLIKECDQDAKIFIITADVQKKVKEEMDSFGILGFINKPFDKEKAQLVCKIINGDGKG